MTGITVGAQGHGARGHEAQEALRVLCRELRADLDALADRLVARILERDDVYDALGTAVVDDLRETCRSNLERALVVLAGDLPADVGASSLVVATGRRRARQGVPLEVVLRGYRLCGRLLWERLLDVSRERHPGRFDDALPEAATLVWKMIDNSSGRLVDAYRAEESRGRGRDLARRYAVVEGLIEGRGHEPAFLREAAQVLGLGERSAVLCLVAPVDGDDDPLPGGDEALLAHRLGVVWHHRRAEVVGLVPVVGPAVGPAAGGLDGAVPAADEAAVRSRLASALARAGTAVGTSPVVGGLAALDGAHRLATLAARAAPAGRTGVVDLDEHLPEALLVDAPEVAVRLRRVALGRLADLPEPERSTLLETLAAVLAADGSPSRAAAGLFCHRNTVRDRVARIEAATGRRLDVPGDRLLLDLALRVRDAG